MRLNSPGTIVRVAVSDDQDEWWDESVGSIRFGKGTGGGSKMRLFGERMDGRKVSEVFCFLIDGRVRLGIKLAWGRGDSRDRQ